MPFNHKHKLLFIHIPKTGGWSIETFFHMLSPNLFVTGDCITHNGILHSKQHLPIALLKTCLDDGIFNNYFKFAFVRNPYDRVISEYFYRMRHSKSPAIPFNTWAFEYYTNIDHDHKIPQHEFVYENGKCALDYVGKFETINKDFKTLLSMLNMDTSLKLPYTNYRVKTTIDPIIDKETLDFIYNIYERDFELFGYDKVYYS